LELFAIPLERKSLDDETTKLLPHLVKAGLEVLKLIDLPSC
jgi:hypothetical protein